jgi:hypothetical protein
LVPDFLHREEVVVNLRSERREFMRLDIVIALLAGCLVGCTSSINSNQRALEGHGVLPPVAEMSGPQGERSPRFALRAESPEMSSRMLFSAEDGDLRVSVREYSVSPHSSSTISKSANDSVLEMWTDRGVLTFGGHKHDWKQGEMLAVRAGSSIELTNPTDRELVARLYSVEAR